MYYCDESSESLTRSPRDAFPRRLICNFIAWRHVNWKEWLSRVTAGCLYLDHLRWRRTRAEVRSWDQVVRRSRPESQQHPPMLLSGDRLGLHRDQDRAVLTVPSHEIHVFLRKRSRDDKTIRRFTVTARRGQLRAAISHGFRFLRGNRAVDVFRKFIERLGKIVGRTTLEDTVG